MMKLLFLLVIGYVVYLVFKGAMKKVAPPARKPVGEVAHKDPVCGVYVTEEDAVVGKLEGERIYFCSMACLEKYRESLEKKS
jgi:YHS domain-containing protein